MKKWLRYNNIFPLADSQNKNDEEEKLYEVKTIRSCSKEKIESFNINELNINNNSSTNESLGKESSSLILYSNFNKKNKYTIILYIISQLLILSI